MSPLLEMATNPFRFRFKKTILFLPIFLICLFCATVSVFASEVELNLEDGSPVAKPRKAFMLNAGMGYSIGNSLGLQPQLGGYLDLPKSWQAGLKIRLVTSNTVDLYDYFPQTSLDIRKSWLGDEGSDPVRNSEYFGLSIGGYLAYGFGGEKIGLRPLGAIELGKYWMPFDNLPFGMDISLELSRFFSGHLGDRAELVFITTSLSCFYVLP